MSKETAINGENNGIANAIEFIRSPQFRQVVETLNAPGKMVSDTLKIIGLDDRALASYAGDLVQEAHDCMDQFIGQKGDVVVPFSGGYDSSFIAEMALRNSIRAGNHRSIHLVTAITGMTRQGADNPVHQARMIADSLGIPLQHHFLDISSQVRKHVVDKAWEDRKILGWPGLCSGCKILMEVNIARVAEILGASFIPWGYNQYQENLSWPEQDRSQRAVMAEYFSKKHPNLRVESPFFDLVRLPIDPILLLASMGYDPQNRHGEPRCWAAGTNPQSVDRARLTKYVEVKLDQIQEDSNLRLTSELPQPETLLGEAVLLLKQNGQYMQGAHNEDTSGHMTARDNAFGEK